MIIATSRVLRQVGLLTILLLPSCSRVGIGFTKIGDIVAHPQNFSAQEVRIRGRVTNVLKVPLCWDEDLFDSRWLRRDQRSHRT